MRLFVLIAKLACAAVLLMATRGMGQVVVPASEDPAALERQLEALRKQGERLRKQEEELSKRLAEARKRTAERKTHYFKVEVRGTLAAQPPVLGGAWPLQSHVVVVGGHRWGLDFSGNKELSELAQKLSGKTVLVRGTLVVSPPRIIWAGGFGPPPGGFPTPSYSIAVTSLEEAKKVAPPPEKE